VRETARLVKPVYCKICPFLQLLPKCQAACLYAETLKATPSFVFIGAKIFAINDKFKKKVSAYNKNVQKTENSIAIFVLQ
jgi:hypothetical protein